MGCIQSKESPAELGIVSTTPKISVEQGPEEADAGATGSNGSRSEQLISDDEIASIRDELKTLIDAAAEEGWDDGSYGPLFIRLAWHSSGTYSPKDALVGGSNGATIRFAPEKDDPENAGLAKAVALLKPIKDKHPLFSFSDLFILAAYVFIEASGGPVIPFEKGRNDKTAPHAVKPGRLPVAEPPSGFQGLDEQGRVIGWESLAADIRTRFRRMGFVDQEVVALMCGGHVYGRCHPQHSGYSGAWVEEPTAFSNEYAADLLEDEWIHVTHDTTYQGKAIPDEVRPAKGKHQYIEHDGLGLNWVEDPEAKPQMMLVADMVMLWDEDFKTTLQLYADDEELLKKDFGAAYKKLTTLGFSGCPVKH